MGRRKRLVKCDRQRITITVSQDTYKALKASNDAYGRVIDKAIKQYINSLLKEDK